MNIKCPKCGGEKGIITTETEWFPALCPVCWGKGSVKLVDRAEAERLVDLPQDTTCKDRVLNNPQIRSAVWIGDEG